MNKNEKAIESVFGDDDYFEEMMRDALSNFYDDLDENNSFEEAVEIFCERARNILAENAACNACGVNLDHWVFRNCGDEMQPNDVQAIIDGHVKCFDEIVHETFDELQAGDIGRAYKLFLQGFKLACKNDSDWTRADWKRYLIGLNKNLDLPDFENIITDFEHWNEKSKVAQKLDTKLVEKDKVKRLKI